MMHITEAIALLEEVLEFYKDFLLNHCSLSKEYMAVQRKHDVTVIELRGLRAMVAKESVSTQKNWCCPCCGQMNDSDPPLHTASYYSFCGCPLHWGDSITI